MTAQARSEAISEVAELTPVQIRLTEAQYHELEFNLSKPMETAKLDELASIPSPFHPVMSNEDMSAWARQAGKGSVDLSAIPAPFVPILED